MFQEIPPPLLSLETFTYIAKVCSNMTSINKWLRLVEFTVVNIGQPRELGKVDILT